MLVMIVPMNVRIRPMIAGTITHAVFRSGLNRIWIVTVLPALFSTPTAACAANRFDPSSRASAGSAGHQGHVDLVVQQQLLRVGRVSAGSAP